MGKRLTALVRNPSATLLIWVGSLTLGLADVLYARLVPGPHVVIDRIALALACAAGLVFVVAAARGVQHYRRAVPAGHRRLGRDAIAREAEVGIGQIEAWLSRQDHSRDG